MPSVKKVKPRRRIVYDPQVFIERLQTLREERGMSKYRFAKMVGASTSLVFWWETGRNNPSIFMLFRIAREFNVSLDWLIGLVEERRSVYEP